MIAAFLEGLITGASLIIAIGAQNAFVLKQGVLRQHVFSIVLLCAFMDAVLIICGIEGLGYLFTTNAWLMLIARYGGATFLAIYGLRAFTNVFKTERLDIQLDTPRLSRWAAIMATLALTLLNPHVYLDTCVLLGSIGSQFPEATRPFFAAGAVCASFIWFFGLGYGARYLAPLFQKPLAWKVLDFIIAIIMWSIAASLVLAH